ncbi:hypothetical protein LOTGIDRAFT_215959 [Lottia gigantea]|uniref:Ubiquitin-like domain-containing protein n=1 Tax=Lottia gigantea TaxID=225164 RepID=V4AEK8_LOTGI|nr:hypothetical protein LOTGIDRAFT_215959 [Lottia gigantea]ESO93575.1 hypothetical protein LOTGIDRAFT_215959 [Lottia gigantea]
MQLFVRATETHTVEVTGDETVQAVMNMVSQKEGFDVEDLMVSYGGKPLEGEFQLSELNDLSTIDVEVRMVGGKVHGSLARAGKVRGQTPKVDKQDKKKKKTGRAKRRSQYNRRFLNVVETFGRKRGPNANAGK